MIARSASAISDYAQSRDAAFVAAQQGLDLFSIARTGDMGIHHAESEHIVWWPEAAGQVLRMTNVSRLEFSGSGAGFAPEPDGKPNPKPPVPPVTWHASLRYFRLSQSTEDLFDSYRNLYLALESILDRIAPQKSTGEREGAWFKRALDVAHDKVGLGPYAPRGSTNPVDDLFKELYKDTRTALFHSKGSRPSLLPHAGKGRETVGAVLERLGLLFIELANRELSSRSGINYLAPAGFDDMTQWLKTRVTLHATDAPEVGNRDNSVINPAEGMLIDLATRHAPELETPFVRALMGHVNGDQMDNLARLTGVVLKLDNGTAMGYEIVKGVLKLSGIARFECQMSVRIQTDKRPRSYFAS